MAKLFNDKLIDLRKDVIVAHVDDKPTDNPLIGFSCRVCNRELFKLEGTNLWQCSGCNTQYPDAVYAKRDPDAVTTSLGDSEIDAGGRDLLSVDPYELYKQTRLTPEQLREKYRRQLFGRLPHAKITREEFNQS